MANYAFIQMEVIPGNIQANYCNMVKFIRAARSRGADCFVFSELALTGYLLGDTWEDLSFLQEAESHLELIKSTLDEDERIIFGTAQVAEGTHTDGRAKLFNVAVNMDAKGKGSIYTKQLLPNYREFDEPRHFTAGPVQDAVLINGETTVSICEDGWDENYGVSPITRLTRGAKLHINLSSSPFTTDKNDKRDRVFGKHAKNNKVFLAYVNNTGFQDNGKNIYGFDGGTCLYGPDGTRIAQIPAYQEGFFTFDTETRSFLGYIGEEVTPLLHPGGKVMKGFESTARFHEESTPVEQHYKTIVAALKSYLPNKRIVIGLSGGIDSAVVAALFVAAGRAGDLILVNMPSIYNSSKTIDAAEEMASNIPEATYRSISISSLVKAASELIGGEAGIIGLPAENLQARLRGNTILATVAGLSNGVYTCNANKTEIAVGYGTLGGDIGGYLAPIGDLWKHQVYDLAEYINKKHNNLIPLSIIKMQPSAELSDAQSIDQGLGDPLVYWYHDRLFRTWIENWNRSSLTEVTQHYEAGTIDRFLGLTGIGSVYDLFPSEVAGGLRSNRFYDDLKRWWNLFVGMGAVKRVQAPPTVVVSRRAFGFDYRESILIKRGV